MDGSSHIRRDPFAHSTACAYSTNISNCIKCKMCYFEVPETQKMTCSLCLFVGNLTLLGCFCMSYCKISVPFSQALKIGVDGRWSDPPHRNCRKLPSDRVQNEALAELHMKEISEEIC